MPISISNDLEVMTVQVPTGPQVLTLSIPGVQGPAGAAGPTTNLTIGTVTTGAAGSSASATITGTAPNLVLNLTIPQGDAGTASNGLPTGGTTDQVLYKINATNFNAGWKTLAKADVGLSNVDNTSDANKPVSTAQQTALNLKANLASPTFTGTVSGITKSMVGLANVDNTADTAKPVSTAQQTALDLKANLASPTFTGTVSGITKSMVGLGNVDNTSDVNKPVSTAQQTAIDSGDGLNAINAQTGTTYTFVLADATRETTLSNAGAITVTIPTNASVAYPIGTVLRLTQTGAGAVTVSATGITLNVPPGFSAGTAGQQATIYARKSATNTWTLTGQLLAATPSVASHLTRKDYVDGTTKTASQISDSTATGRSVLTATDAAAARTAIGAGTSNLAIGTTSTTAKAGDYQPTAANISDSTSVGRSVLTAASAAAARTATGAGVVDSSDATVLNVIKVTQAAYDALGTKVATTLYVIVG